MNTTINSALGKIKAEDELIQKTELFLRNAINGNRKDNVVEFKRKSVLPVKKLIAIACSFAIVFFLSIQGYAIYNTPVAYLSLDINPSVEIGINRFNVVISAEGYNEDGKTILDDINIKNMNVKTAVNNLIDSASENGFIADDGSTVISVTSETDNVDLATSLQDAAIQGVNEAIQESGDKVEIIKDNIALARRDEAKQIGITSGKLNLIQKLTALDSSATVDQFKNSKVSEIMKRIKELKAELKAKENKNSNAKDPKDNNKDKSKDKNTKNNNDNNNGIGNSKDKDGQNVNNKNTNGKNDKQTNGVKPTIRPKSGVKSSNNNKGNVKKESKKQLETPTPTPRPTPKPKPTQKPKNVDTGKNVNVEQKDN